MLISQKKRKIFSANNTVILFLALVGICFGQSKWELINSPPAGNDLYSVTYGNNHFVTIDHAGSILTSSDGTNWIIKNYGTTETFFL